MKIAVAALALSGMCAIAQEERPELSFPSPSYFDATRIAREPFARLDEAKLAVEGPAMVKAAVPADAAGGGLEVLFRVTTISLGRYSLAVINRATFTAGETFMLNLGDKHVPVRVLKINDGNVELQCNNQIVRAPLRIPVPVSLQTEK